jgi:hypothetical protein
MIYSFFALIAGGLAFAFTRSIAASLVNAVIFWLITWFFLPTFAWGYWATVLYLMLLLGSGWAWSLVTSEGYDSSKTVIGMVLTGVAVVFLGVIPILTTWGAFHDTEYRNLLEVTERDFDTHQVLLDQTQARLVDENLASRSAHELLGAEQGLGSKVDIGAMSVQAINGRLWWVGQLEHKSWMKWLNNDTTPGYVMVSVSNYGDRKIVLGQSFRIGMEAYLDDNLVRHLYNNGYAGKGYTDFTFELDDSEKPFWVVTLIEPKVGFDGYVAVGVAIVDPVTGKIESYDNEHVPAWVDRVEPHDLIEDRINDWGLYVKGWSNSWSSGDDVVETSEGISLVYTSDGRSAWYTGLQSKSSGASAKEGGQPQQGTMGFMLVDTHNGKASFYRRAGITEHAAKDVLEGKVQEKGYTASWPIPYLVGGTPTFISILTDKVGNFQMIGMVNYENRNVVAVGTTMDDVMRSYLSVLSRAGKNTALGGALKVYTFEGVVTRKAAEPGKEENLVTLMLDSVPNKAFTLPSHISAEVNLTNPGDHVKVQANDTGSGVIVVTTFDNLDIALEVTDDDKVLQARYLKAQAEAEKRKTSIDAATVLRNVDPETLGKLLEVIRKAGEGN